MALRAQCVKFAGDAFSLIRLEIGNHDFGSLTTQTEGNGAADPLRATGYDSDFPFESHGVTRPPFT
jgi:hypothetical protein